jgi:hypothetical protein
MSTASAEAHAQCAAWLRILHRPGRSPRTQRIRAIRIDAELLSERASLGQRIGTKRKYPPRSRLLTTRQPAEHRTHTPSNRIRPCGELMPPGLFAPTTIDFSACMEKANTRGTAGATGVVVALESRKLNNVLRLPGLHAFKGSWVRGIFGRRLLSARWQRGYRQRFWPTRRAFALDRGGKMIDGNRRPAIRTLRSRIPVQLLWPPTQFVRRLRSTRGAATPAPTSLGGPRANSAVVV